MLVAIVWSAILAPLGSKPFGEASWGLEHLYDAWGGCADYSEHAVLPRKPDLLFRASLLAQQAELPASAAPVLTCFASYSPRAHLPHVKDPQPSPAAGIVICFTE
jgi:hypothetical protein